MRTFQQHLAAAIHQAGQRAVQEGELRFRAAHRDCVLCGVGRDLLELDDIARDIADVGEVLRVEPGKVDGLQEQALIFLPIGARVFGDEDAMGIERHEEGVGLKLQ